MDLTIHSHNMYLCGQVHARECNLDQSDRKTF